MKQIYRRILSKLRPRTRRLQDFEAAFGILDRIRQSEHSSFVASHARRDLLSAQMEALSRFIWDRRVLAGDPDAESKCIDALSSLAKEMRGVRQPPPPMAPTLDQVEALLEIGKITSVGDATESETSVSSSARIASSDLSATNPTVGELESGELQPSETAFLWASTEKLYNSWPFRFLGMLMLAAVLLAGAGTFFIGGQTLQLRQNLENAARSATTDLQELGKQTHATLSEQRAGLIADMEHRSSEIHDALAKATEQIKDLDQLKEKAVNQIVDAILAKSTDLEARLRREIADNLTKIENDDVRDLKGRADALQANIKQLAAETDDGARQLKGSQPDLQRIIQLTREADKLEAELGAIGHARVSAVEASEKTEAAHIAAQAAATDAARMRQDLAEKMKSISTEIDTDQRNLGIAQERLSKLSVDTNQASNTTGQLAKSVGGINERLKVLDQQLTGVEDEITKLRNRAQQAQQIPASGTAPAAPAFLEAELTHDQWRLIQNSLKARGFSQVRVDGWPGPVTSAAIGSFQTKMGAPATGHLTSEQFDLLIRPQSTDKPK
jgi:hypothetical protein